MSPLPLRATATLVSLLLAATAAADHGTRLDDIEGTDGVVLEATELATFNRPWAMTFLPDRRALVSEKAGGIWLLDEHGRKLSSVDNAPTVDMRGQGGMGDVIAHPDFADNGTVYLSWIERDADDDARSGAVVEKATLTLRGDAARLSDRRIIWRQSPKLTGNGHYSHRLALSPDGYLFITSGDRQHFHPSQNMAMNLGKILRLNQDGSVPDDNPFA
ncbi:MAG: PQQ-dependent sugar dehydrogenase, partial [Pseudomonadota bacterium]